MFTELPYSLTVDGEEKPIYTDFRNIILICNSFNDDELNKSEKLRIMLDLLYENKTLHSKSKNTTQKT